MAEKVKVLVIGGATACGKSEIAVEVAQIFNGEIINADSVQIYRDLNIGTAKPERELMNKVPHHLFDVADISDPWDVKRYEEEAKKVVMNVYNRGKLPILVGGSGFYIKGLLEGVTSEAVKDESLREYLYTLDDNLLYEKLKEIDPKRAASIHPHDKKRIVRALEIYYLTGKKPSDFGFSGKDRFNSLKVAIVRERLELKRRIEERVDRMIERGFLKEVESLLKKYGEKNRILSTTLGYRELILYFKGEISLSEAISLIKKRTWEYAKKQIRWFKKEGFIFFTLPEEKEKLINFITGWLFQ